MSKLKFSNKYSTYPKYKNSGVEWLGKIPESWSCDYFRGYTKQNRVKNLDGNNRNLLSLSYGKIIDKDIDTNGGLLPESFNTYQIVRKGDIVMRLTDLQNDKKSLRVGYVEQENGIITSAYLGLIIGQEVDTKFMYYLLHSYDLQKVFYNLGAGVRQILDYKNMKYLQILLPPKEEQERIARFLDEQIARIDETIAKKERLIELLKEKRTATINHAVTKGLDPNAELVNSCFSWAGNIPHGWEIKPLKHLATLQEGPGIMAEDFRDSGVPLLRIRNLKNREISLVGSNHLDEEKANTKWKHFKLNKGDLLVSGSASTGVVSEVGDNAVGTIPYTGLIRITARKVDKDFLYYILASRYFNEQIDVQKTGTAMQHFGPTHLKKVGVALPPHKVQIEIARELERTSENYLKTQNELSVSIDLLHEFKSSLISHAVTGKIKV